MGSKELLEKEVSFQFCSLYQVHNTDHRVAVMSHDCGTQGTHNADFIEFVFNGTV